MSSHPASDSDANPDSTGAAEPLVPQPAVAAIDCETTVRRLWDYLDGGLIAPSRLEVEAHLASCTDCPPHFAFATATLIALAGSRPDALSRDEDALLRARVMAVLSDAGAR